LPKEIPPNGAMFWGSDVIDRLVTRLPDWHKLSDAELSSYFIEGI
jgi:hypothetical protein